MVRATNSAAGSGCLDGKTAIVTGGSRGIGRAIVHRLAADGASVVFCYGSNETQAKEVVAEVDAEGGRAWAVRTDLGDLNQIEELFQAADAHFEQVGGAGLDILVNSAGTFVRTPLGSTEGDDYERLMTVNARASFFAIQHATSRLKAGGRIVSLSTVTTRWPRLEESVYAASKAALEQFTWIATRELGPRGITVNIVSPGPTDSGDGGMLRSATTEEARDEVSRQTPLGALGKPSDIAGVVAFLVGPDGGWVSGQNIRVDGGLVW